MWLLKKTQGKILILEKKIQTKDNIAINLSNNIVKVVVEGQRTTFDFQIETNSMVADSNTGHETNTEQLNRIKKKTNGETKHQNKE